MHRDLNEPFSSHLIKYGSPELRREARPDPDLDHRHAQLWVDSQNVSNLRPDEFVELTLRDVLKLIVVLNVGTHNFGLASS